MNKESKWLKFKEVGEKPKTRVFEVWSKCSNCILGEIKWYGRWRHYCYFVTDCLADEFVYSDRCLLEISEFITKLNQEYNNKTGYTRLMKK